MKYQKIPGLDGLRGFAALLVLFSHAGHYGLNFHPALNFAGVGRYGVFLFFSLSAFLLSLQMLSAKRDLYSVEYVSHYFYRRIFRILPLYFTVILVFWLTGFTSETGGQYFTGLKSVLRAATMQHAPGVLWAIPPEFKFYFILPVLVFLISGFRSRKLLILCLLVLSMTASGFVFAPKYGSSVFPFMCIFLSGLVAAFLVSEFSENFRKKTLAVPTFIGGIGALVAFVVLVPSWIGFLFSKEVPFTIFHHKFLFFSLISGLLILSICINQNGVARFFELPFLRRTGKISFSLYLWHVLLVAPVLSLPFIKSAPLQTLLFFVVSFAVAEISYRFIERPFLKSRFLEQRFALLTKRFTQRVGPWAGAEFQE